MDHERPQGAEDRQIRVSGIEIEWHPQRGICTFGDLPVAMMWVDTTLAGLMSGVQAMVGTERFVLALQSEGRKSVEADWQVISAFRDFREGFDAIANVAAVAGWGDWQLTSLERERKECRFRVKDSWEGRYQKALGVCWGSGMLAGKMAGYGSKLFETNCWADQVGFAAKGDPYDEFVVRPSSRSLEKEIENLLESDEATRADMAVALRKLEKEITDRRRTEEALRQSEEKYRVLVENAGEVIFVAQGGMLRFVNRKTMELIGYSREELTSRPFVEFIHPDDRDMVLGRHVERQQGIEIPPHYFFRIVTKSGDTRWVDLNVVLIEWEGSHATLNFMTDITEQKRAEEALRESELFLKETQGIARLGGWKANPHTDYLEWTDGIYDILQAPRDYRPGLSEGLQIFLPEYIPRILDRVENCLSTGESFALECQVTTTSGKRIWTEVRGIAAVLGGERSYVMGTLQDITERKRAEADRIDLERRLLDAQKLESLGVLAGGIAHDFNNLLMAILGNLDLALLDMSQTSPARPAIEKAVNATHRAADLTRQLLAYSGRGNFIVARVDLCELVRENGDLFRAAMARTVTMKLNLAVERATVEADPGQVQQVIMNLITNASEAIGEEPGIITLTVGIRECDEAYLRKSRLSDKPPAGPFVYLEVSDTGGGMEEETLQRIFDPFFTTKFTGRGLGLSAVLGIVRSHKGAIMLDSGRGRGTAVRVLFPACETGSDEMDGESGRSPQRSDAESWSGTVLVVDDDKAVRKLCAAFVQRLGFQVVEAADGEEALRLFEKQADQIACVLLDLTMPRMDGVTAFQEMRRLCPEVKVILCSGYNEQDATQRFAAKGLAGFIQKPYRLEELRVAMKGAMRGTR
jgi:two-component system, cell cycle sensor histidine kinase and response regulator CckA